MIRKYWGDLKIGDLITRHGEILIVENIGRNNGDVYVKRTVSTISYDKITEHFVIYRDFGNLGERFNVLDMEDLKLINLGE